MKIMTSVKKNAVSLFSVQGKASDVMLEALNSKLSALQILKQMQKIYLQSQTDQKEGFKQAKSFYDLALSQVPNLSRLISEFAEDPKQQEITEIQDSKITEQFLQTFRLGILKPSTNKKIEGLVPSILIIRWKTIFGYDLSSDSFYYYVYINGHLRWVQDSKFSEDRILDNYYFYDSNQYFNIRNEYPEAIEIHLPDLNEEFSISLDGSHLLGFSHNNVDKTFGDSISEILEKNSQIAKEANNIIAKEQQVPLQNIISEYLL